MKAKKIFSLIVFLFFIWLNISGQVTGDFRSKAAGPGNWNDFNAWERYNGSAWAAATSGQLPIATSTVEIQAGHSIIINAAALTSGNLNVNGLLTYIATPASTLTVSGNVTVSATGSFTSPSSGTIITHALNIGGSTATGIGGNLVVNGIFNMNVFSTAGVLVTFYGTPNNTISGAGSVINFYSINVNKGASSYNSILEVVSSTIITIPDATATVTQRLTSTVGTFKLSSASILKPYYGTATPNSPPYGRLWLNNALAIVQSVGAGTTTPSGGTLNLGGMLQIDAGTFSYGAGNSTISCYGGFILGGPNATLNVYGMLMSGSSSTFTMTAGNINIYSRVGANTIPAGSIFNTKALLQFNGTSLAFSGGTVTLFDPNVNNGIYDYSLNLTSGNFTGSTLRFGNGISDIDGSASGFTVNPGSSIFGNIIVNNSTSSSKLTRIVKLLASTTIAGNLTINAGTANQFQLNGFVLTSKGNIANAGSFIFDGTAASGLVFSGTAQQTMGGAGIFSTNVNNLTINNTSGATPSVDIQVPLSISNSLTLTKGILGSSNSSVFTIGKAASSTTFNLTRSGGSFAAMPTFALGGVTLNNVTYSAPSPAASITTSVELPAATQITTLTISNVSGVTLDKPVTCTTLALTSGILTATSTNTVTVTGTLPSNITGGSASAFVNGPLTITLPATASAANYRFPVGKAGYRLFEFSNITTSGSGTSTFTAEAFDAGSYSGTAGTGLGSINTDKYWSIRGNLGSVTISSSVIRLTDAGLGATNKIGQSSTFNGTYNSVGGSVTGSTLIASTTPIDYSAISTGTFFRIGSASPFLAGNYAIGPQATYAGYARTFQSLSAAIGAITSVPLTGNMIFEFQSDYNPAIESFPITMTANIGTNAGATVVFRPAASVSSLINFIAATNALTNAGADYVTFDGRNGGAGSNRYLKFTNTTTAGSVITLSTDATYNQLQYLLIKGSTTTASSGLLLVNAPSSGNNFLTVNNSIFDASGSANNCIYVSGTATDAIITNNNFFDYRNGAGVYLANGSNNSVIDNNNFYQTLTYNGFAGTTYGIFATGGNNCRISNNNIGGSGPTLSGIWTVSATSPAAYNFTGISASLATTSKIYNNKIQNFDWKSNASTWTGMNVSGSVNVGTDGANYVGNNTSADNIKVTYFANGAAQINGIIASGTGTVRVENNNIGSITTLPSGVTGVGSSIAGISFSATTIIVNNNVIGSTTIPTSIKAGNQSTTGNAQNVYGINGTGGSSITISGNTIANLFNGMTFTSASAGMTRGIRVYSGSSISISSNSIYSLSTSQQMTGAISAGSSAHSITGIDLNNSATINVTGNTIYDLVNTSASGAVSVLGIYCQTSTSVAGIFEKNYIHSFKTVSNAAIQTGLNINYGLCTMRNNVIRLGTDEDNNSITSATQINGILKTTYSICNFYFNTVYILGSGVADGAVFTYAFNEISHSAETRDIRNNLFVNSRSGGLNAKHYAVKIIGTTANQAGLTCNYNDLFVSGTGGIIGYYNSADQVLMSNWRTATGKDANSLNIDPQFTSSTDLMPMNAAIAAGTPISGITLDFTGLTRNTITPSIGAYEYVMPVNKTLNLTLFLENLYAGGGLMNQAQNDLGNQFSGNTVDQITVELHDQTTYATIIYSAGNVNLSTSGLATVTIPVIYNGNYYITVKHRNSIETVTASSVSFSLPTINYNFSTSAAQSFGGNIKDMGNGVFAIYGGDENGDGVIDVFDLSDVQNDAVIFATGYLPTDINGDGVIDIFDLSLLQNNSLLFISTITP